MNSIKAELERNKVKTRRGNDSWTKGTLQLMLRNQVYTGVDEYYDKKFKETIVAKVPQIIGDSLFNEVRERRESILLRKGQLSRTSKFYLFRDFMVCGDCGTPMGGRQSPEQKRNPFYYCPISERKFNKAEEDNRTCSMKRSLHIEAADSEIWQVIYNVITNSGRIKEYIFKYNLLGAGLSEAKVVDRKNEIQSTISELNETKSKIEKGLIKVEAQNMMGEFDSPEIYKGVKRNLSSQLNTIKVKIERAQSEHDQLGNHQLWFDWIDQFASEFTSTNNFTPDKKRHLVNGVVKDILVSYDQAQKLHRVRVNFRLPVLRSVGEILRANNAVLKRGVNSPKESQTLEKTGAPETVRSNLLHRHRLRQIPRLVHVTATNHRDMITQQLQGNHRQ
jgi:hypothetical protein